MKKDIRLLERLNSILSAFPGMRTTHIRIEVMKKDKKDQYKGASIRRFITNGKEKMEEELIIYVNFRDSKDENDILRQVAHEAAYLVDGPNEELKVLDMLRGELYGRKSIGSPNS